MRTIYSVSIVDSNSLSCEGVRRILGRHHFRIAKIWPDMEAAASEGQVEAGPAAILLNVAGRPMPCALSLGRLREAFPKSGLVLVSEKPDTERIQKAIHAGIDGFFLETMPPEVFSKALELIVLGEKVYPVVEPATIEVPETDRSINPAFEELSESQMRVVALLAKAHPNKVIARELNITESTVKVHVKAILRKTGARNRTDVALLARGSRPEAAADPRPRLSATRVPEFGPEPGRCSLPAVPFRGLASPVSAWVCAGAAGSGKAATHVTCDSSR